VTEANPEKMEPNPEIMQSEAEHQEIPKERAIVKPVGGRMRRNTGWHLAAERREKPKDGLRKKLAAAGRKMTRCAGVARRKESHKGPAVEQG
jgi:hypothetical protein